MTPEPDPDEGAEKNMNDPMRDLVAGLAAMDRQAYERMWSDTQAPRWGLGERPAILVIDMVSAFIDPAYSSSVGASGSDCVARLCELLDAGRTAGIPIVYFTTQPLSTAAEVGAWARGRPPKEITPFNLQGSVHEVVPELSPGAGDIVLAKAKPSGFFGTQLLSVLHYLGTDSVVVTGTTTSGCVRATVVDAFSYNYRVVVPVDGVADRAPLSHRVELLDMGTRYADLVTVADLVEAWTAGERCAGTSRTVTS
jgi:nicotinamidase-related amidase